ncbi:MAG: TIR domain-containing protein, partial [Planctomycetes bacterium]|nr:TIR domain-containing protein [Planctomycetota bacterium]
WDKNDLFDFSFYDGSVTVPVNSTEAGPIRRVISQRIAACPRFLCIVGKHTSKSGWVKWEIDKAVELNRSIIAVKTERSNTTPAGLYGVGAGWALSFTFDAIKKAIDDA